MQKSAPMCVRATDVLSVVQVTTEMSVHMAKSLRTHGWLCWETDIASPGDTARYAGHFQLVSMLNVLDRAPRPAALLEAAHKLMQPGGWLLLATPLPYDPFYYQGATVVEHTLDSEAALPLRRRTTAGELCGFEDHAEELLADVLPSHGFEPAAFTQLPYITSNPVSRRRDNPLYHLDDFVVLARRVEKPRGDAAGV